MTQLFISHSHHDVACANRIRTDLERHGYAVWQDVERLVPGAAWPPAVQEGITQSDAVLVVWSGTARRSNWVSRELALADAVQKPTIPLVIDDTPLNIHLKAHPSILAGPTCDNAVPQLLPYLPPPEKPLHPLAPIPGPRLVSELTHEVLQKERRQRSPDRRRRHVIDESVRPAMRDAFFDRALDIDWLNRQLVAPDARLVTITGRAGFGKTALVAHVLAGAEQGSLATDSFQVRVAGVAYFNAEQLTLGRLYLDFGALLGDPYASLFDSVRQREIPPEQKATWLVDQLARACRNGEVIIVMIDGLEKVLDEHGDLTPSRAEIGHWLQACLENETPIRLVATSRRNLRPPPGTETFVKWRELATGLPEPDAMALLHELEAVRPGQIARERDLLARVVRQTGGVPLALRNVAEILRKRDRRGLKRLLDESTQFEIEITSLMIKHVFRGLNLDEQRVWEALATFRFAASTPAIAYLLQREVELDRVQDTLLALASRHFVIYHEEEATWSLHDADRQVAEAELVRRPGAFSVLNARAGRYYEAFGMERDRLSAVYHYQRAEEFAQAAQLATADVWTLITQGQAAELRQRLEQFSAAQLDMWQWILVQVSLGDAYRFLGEGDLAQTRYRSALELLAAQPPTPSTPVLRARAYLGLGDLLRQTSLPEAHTHLHKGLDALAGEDEPQLAAELNIKLGTIEAEQGKYDSSIETTSQGLALLGDETSQLRVRALINLGRCYYLGKKDVDEARRLTQQAVVTAEGLRDLFWQLKALNNLALLDEISGQWTDALSTYKRALQLHEQLGSPPGERVQLSNNLSVLYSKSGDFDRAATQLEDAAALARNHGLARDLAYVLAGQADLAVRMAQFDRAAAYLAEAEQLANTANAGELLPELYYLWSHAHRGQTHHQAALEAARTSLGLTDEPYHQGRGRQALALALLAEGQVVPALDALEESLHLLADVDPYELARSQVLLGVILVEGDARERGLELLHRAQTTFRQLGAQRDLAAVDQVLGAG